MAEFKHFEDIRRAFKEGTIQSATNESLQAAIAILANTTISNDHVKHEAGIMNEAINGILLRRILDAQETRNQTTQFWFMVLALAGVLAAVGQVVLAIFQGR